VANVPAAGPELVKLAWERVKDRFSRLDTVVVAILDLADSAKAGRVSRERAKAPSLAEAARRVDASLAVIEIAVHYPNAEPEWQLLQAMFTSQPAGMWMGPEKRGERWRILQILRKVTTEQKFEELPPGLQQNITGSAGELARDARFNQFTDSLAAALHPIVDHGRIARLPWPVPEPVDVGR
jgi:hypothetical protein